MKVKVCGMREADNICQVGQLPIHWMGFIFYASSPRYVGNLSPELIQLHLPQTIQRIGVFVNESEENIWNCAQRYNLYGVQLHGNESPDFCLALKAKGLCIIKAFSIAEGTDLDACRAYEGTCHYFLFDTKTPFYGGSGKQYDWSILFSYQGQTPFFLSGGIGEEDVERLQSFFHPLCKGIDLNSRFEMAPGKKDVKKLRHFLSRLSGKTSDLY